MKRLTPFPEAVTRDEQARLLKRIREGRRQFRRARGYAAPEPFRRDEHLPMLLRRQAE